MDRLEVYQLLDAQLFPASLQHPKTAFTFTLLDTLFALTMRGKISAYDYYVSLCSLTDNYDLSHIPSRYEELNTAIRRYRNLLALKRSGIGHKECGVDNLEAGELAVECPAAPLVGRNVPDNWQEVYKDQPHLRAQYVALDANFRLKRKDREIRNEPSLTANSGYFVDPHLFAQELQRFQDLPPVRESSSCDSSFAAIERANSRYNRGYAVTGVVAAIDSRHGFVLPNGVADLQRGERYFNTDFVFLSSLCNRDLNLIFVSYDIACQWERHLRTRLTSFPLQLRSHLPNLEIICAIPKFHLPAHGFSCWTRYSFNFIPGSCRVDGEAIERLWASTNPVATSTREMKSGTRHDFLSERWGTQNFRKVVGMGDSLQAKFRAAVEGFQNHKRQLEDLSSSQHPDIIRRWTELVDQYHEDPDAHPDPYQVHSKGKLRVFYIKLSYSNCRCRIHYVRSS